MKISAERTRIAHAPLVSAAILHSLLPITLILGADVLPIVYRVSEPFASKNTTFEVIPTCSPICVDQCIRSPPFRESNLGNKLDSVHPGMSVTN
jgi:hypothetical protein